MADNSITLVGNMTRAPEIRFTNTGRATCSFGLAVNRRYQQNGEWVEQVSFFNIVAWAELAENSAQSLDKGNRVIVTGRLEQRTYEDKEGETKSIIEVVADSIGPDLRWATAEISRTARTDNTERDEKPAAKPKAKKAAPAADPYDSSEPF